MIEAASPRDSENEISERICSVPRGEGYSLEMFSTFSTTNIGRGLTQIDADHETKKQITAWPWRFFLNLIRAYPRSSAANYALVSFQCAISHLRRTVMLPHAARAFAAQLLGQRTILENLEQAIRQTLCIRLDQQTA